MNGYGMQGPSLYGGMQSGVAQQQQPEQSQADMLDDAAFERAFEAAKEEMLSHEEVAQQENLELGQDVLLQRSEGSQLQSDHLVEQDRIGSDRIYHESQEEQQDLKDNDPDELARTAGQLLESVKDDQSQKFQESNFLALMRRLRDREVRVEGDKMVDNNGTINGQEHSNSADIRMTGAISSDEFMADGAAEPLKPTTYLPTA